MTDDGGHVLAPAAGAHAQGKEEWLAAGLSLPPLGPGPCAEPHCWLCPMLHLGVPAAAAGPC